MIIVCQLKHISIAQKKLIEKLARLVVSVRFAGFTHFWGLLFQLCRNK